jgi:hypothetical protein
LQDAATKGTVILFQIAFSGIEVDLTLMAAMNNLLFQRATELEIACGLRPPGTPVSAATPMPGSGTPPGPASPPVATPAAELTPAGSPQPTT